MFFEIIENKNKYMRKIFIIFCLLFNLSVFSQEEISIIIYKKKSNTIIDAKKENTNAGIFVKKMAKEMENVEYTLKFNKNSAVFFETSKMNLEKDENSLVVEFSKTLGGGNGIYYVNRKTNKTFHEREFESELYLVEQDKISNWTLTQEKKKIGNYNCFKATKNDTFVGSSGNLITIKIIAWYTPEIPFSYGPIKYNGLPGLILELENDKVIFYASKIELHKKDSKEKVLQPKKGIKITQSRYDSIIKGLAKDFNKKYKRN
jgi:GLPGLI family protein